MFRGKSKKGNFVTKRLAPVQIVLHLNISTFFNVDNETNENDWHFRHILYIRSEIGKEFRHLCSWSGGSNHAEVLLIWRYGKHRQPDGEQWET